MTSANPARRSAATGAPLDAYLRRMREIPLLDREGAVRATRRAGHVGMRAAHARASLVNAHLGLVVGIAREHVRDDIPLASLIRAGTAGLARAAEEYDDAHGCAFATYASWWIRRSVVRAAERGAPGTRGHDDAHASPGGA